MRSIDIVRENQGIQFPKNVVYNFVYWQHTPDNIQPAIEAAGSNDVVALELANFASVHEHSNESQVAAAGRFQDYINVALQKGYEEPELMSWLKKTDEVQPDFATAFALRYAGSGKELYFVDAWIHSDAPTHPTQSEASNGLIHLWDTPSKILNINMEFADSLAQRESITLRQLADIGYNLSADKPDSLQVGVVYGSAHSLLSVGMRDLGAQVTRTFVDGPRYASANEMMVRTMRATGASPERIKMMSLAIYMARTALLEYMDLDPNAPALLARNYGEVGRVKADALLTSTLLKDDILSAGVARTIADYLVVKPGKGIFEARRQKKRQEAFMNLIQFYIRSAERLSDSMHN